MLGIEPRGSWDGLPRARSVASAVSGSSRSAPSTTRHRATSWSAARAVSVPSAPFTRSSRPWQNQLIGSSPTELPAPFMVCTWR